MFFYVGKIVKKIKVTLKKQLLLSFLQTKKPHFYINKVWLSDFIF